MSNQVAITPCNTYNKDALCKMIPYLIEYLPPSDLKITKGDTVLIKANIGLANDPEVAATTHPEVVRAVVRYVKDKGGIPLVGDDPIITQIADETLQVSGIKDMAFQEGVDVLVFERHGGFAQKACKKSFILESVAYSCKVIEADWVISVPKLKTHILTRLSCAVKNMFGCIERRERQRIHKLEAVRDFSSALIDIYRLRVPDLTIVDGVVGMVGIGPSSGIPAQIGALMASSNGYAIDETAAMILGYDPEQIDTIAIAREWGLGGQKPIEYPLSHPEEWEKGAWPLVPFISEAVRKRFRKFLLTNLFIDSTTCQKCNECADHCPNSAISGTPPVIDADLCILCFCCFELCPTSAVKLKIPGIVKDAKVVTRKDAVEQYNLKQVNEDEKRHHQK